jgi:hypothetical protein
MNIFTILGLFYTLGDERLMLVYNNERKKRRQIILKGISQDLNPYEISAQLGANRWLVKSDIRFMRRNGDLGLKEAEKAQIQVRNKKAALLEREKEHFKQNERFLNITGITIKEKSFRNMIDFNKHKLLKILKSEDQHTAITRLPKNIRKILKKKRKHQ